MKNSKDAGVVVWWWWCGGGGGGVVVVWFFFTDNNTTLGLHWVALGCGNFMRHLFVFTAK